MGGCRCSYKNCQNTTKATENIHYFHYPVKHKERCAIWIQNAQKPEFCDLEEDQLRNKVICEVHFENKWFANPHKKRLLQSAVPTLDGYEEKSADKASLTPLETPTFVSSEFQDIQVLPANEDGTIFVLDTETVFGKVQKVESYLYKNGMIVPSNTKSRAESKIGSPKVIPMPTANLSTTEEVVEKVENKHTLNPSNPSNTRRLVPTLSAGKRKEDLPDCKVVKIKKESPEFEETEESEQGLYEYQGQEITSRSPGVSSLANKNSSETDINQLYLRKIKQHSRDIANIKRMLREKVLDPKPNIKTVLNDLQEVLPPSLFTVVNLCLSNKCELSEEDIEFFTTLHKTSPEAYQLLVDKFKWNLPCVDVVEGPME